MKPTSVSFVLCILLVIALSLPCYGDEKSELAELKAQIEALQEQLTAMQAQHAAEIGALQKRLNTLAGPDAEHSGVQADVVDLRALAEAEAKKEEPADTATEDVTFKAGALSLQALNPEISVTGDMIGTYQHQKPTTDNWRFNFRGLGLHFESYLDPYTRFKAAVSVNENEAKLGEAYMTRFGIWDDFNLTLGKFRQQFGVVNRWHKHALDQVDFPLALRRIFGDGGLNQTGLSLDWNMPAIGGNAQELTFQFTNGENARLFGDNSWDTPSMLLHYKNFRDLTKSTYLEFGTTAMVGWNDEWDVRVKSYDDGTTFTLWTTKKKKLPTWIFGGDLSLLWEPTGRMRYRNLEWRTEFYYLDRQIQDPFAYDRDHLNAWGGYSYLQAKLSRRWETGVRLDYYEPDQKRYAALPQVSLAPLAYPEKDAYRWQVGPYLTWHQSPFVRFRLEYNHEDGHGMEEPEDRIMLQMIFAAGPHKHERY